MRMLPTIHDIQESQRNHVKKEQELIRKLQKNFWQELEAERTGIQRPLFYDPGELEQEYLEHMTRLRSQQAQVFTTIQQLRRQFEERDEDMASMAAMRVPVPGRHDQQRKEMLEYLLELQPELAQRMLGLSRLYEDQEKWKNRHANTDTNVPHAGPSTMHQVHPRQGQPDFQNTHDLASQAALHDGFQEMHVRDGEDGVGYEHEDPSLQQWGRQWDVRR